MMLTQPNPNKRQHPGTPLGRLLNRYAISLADLAKCLLEEKVEFNSRSTLHRLVHDKISDDMKKTLHPPTARCLSKFLIARGLPKAEIDAELTAIFSQGEYQPMISKRIELTPQAIKYFGLREDAFKLPPRNKSEVYISPDLQLVIDRVVDAIQYQGFVSITGEIGSGKSTIRQLIEDRVFESTNMILVWPEFFDMARVTAMQIAASLLEDMHQPVPNSAIRRARAVKGQLKSHYQDGKRVAIAFDECHRLNDLALSSLKNFLEMSSGGFQRYLGVVLFGQPIFEARLKDPIFRELAERIVNIKMPEFSASAEGYLRHRMEIVGADLDKLFDREAIDLLCRQATTPLQLGNLANEALKISMESFDEKRVIGAAIKTKMFFASKDEPGFRRRAA